MIYYFIINTCRQARCGYIGYCWFVCLCVCTVTDFSAEDKASGVIFCKAVYRRPGQGISHFGELCSPKIRRIGQRATTTTFTTITLWLRNTWQRAACARRIGMCGYTAVPYLLLKFSKLFDRFLCNKTKKLYYHKCTKIANVWKCNLIKYP